MPRPRRLRGEKRAMGTRMVWDDQHCALNCALRKTMLVPFAGGLRGVILQCLSREAFGCSRHFGRVLLES